jgi:hypothetical protein
VPEREDDLLQANTIQIDRAAIDVLVEPWDEGVLVVGVAADKNPVV